MSAARLVGHSTVVSLLQSLIEADRLPQTVLFSGPLGVGKAVAAHNLAGQLLCRSAVEEHGVPFGGCGHCKSCLQMSKGSHPDLHLVDGFDAHVNLDEVRTLLAELQLMPYEGNKSVVIFDHAEALSVAVFNTLLKVLEEPGSHLFFILVSASFMRIPITIRSRCAVFNFGRLSEAEVMEVLRLQTDIPAERCKRIARLVDGTVGDALGLLDKEGVYAELEAALDGIFSGDMNQAASLASRLHKQKDDLRENLNFMRLHSVARAKRKHCDRIERRAWATCLANLIDADALIFDRHVSAEQALMAVFSALAASSDNRIYERM